MARKQKGINRKDGRVNVSFRFNGKVYSVTAPTKEAAILKKQERLEQLRTGKEKRENPTVAYYYEHVFTPNRRDKVKESTIRAQVCQFKDAAGISIEGTGKTFGQLRMRDVKAMDVQTVQRALRESGRTTETVNDILAHLKHVFSRACRDRTITWNPCVTVDKLQRVEPKCKDTKHRALTEQETKDFFEAMSGSYYENLCRTMVLTGMRIGEVSALNMTDIDLKDDVLHVTKTVARHEDGTYFISPTPKTDSGFRDIPLTREVKQIIMKQVKVNEQLFGSISLTEPIFRSFTGQLMREYSVNREIKRKCKETGIELFTSHAFRDTFATRFIEQSPEDYKILSEILGHADVTITLNLYTAHKSKDKQQAAMNRVVIAI